MPDSELSDKELKAIKRQIAGIKKLVALIRSTGGKAPAGLDAAAKRLEAAARGKDDAGAAAKALDEALQALGKDMEDIAAKLSRKGATVKDGKIVVLQTGAEAEPLAKDERIKLKKTGGTLAVAKGKPPTEAVKTAQTVSVTETDLRKDLGQAFRARY